MRHRRLLIGSSSQPLATGSRSSRMDSAGTGLPAASATSRSSSLTGETYLLGWTTIRASKVVGSSCWRLMLLGSRTGASELLVVYGGAMRVGADMPAASARVTPPCIRRGCDRFLPDQHHCCAVRVRRTRGCALAILVFRCAGPQSLWSSWRDLAKRPGDGGRLGPLPQLADLEGVPRPPTGAARGAAAVASRSGTILV